MCRDSRYSDGEHLQRTRWSSSYWRGVSGGRTPSTPDRRLSVCPGSVGTREKQWRTGVPGRRTLLHVVGRLVGVTRVPSPRGVSLGPVARLRAHLGTHLVAPGAVCFPAEDLRDRRKVGGDQERFRRCCGLWVGDRRVYREGDPGDPSSATRPDPGTRPCRQVPSEVEISEDHRGVVPQG